MEPPPQTLPTLPTASPPLPGTFGQLPDGPAVRPVPPPPAAPGSLGTVDWASYPHAADCPSARPGTAVPGDLDGDGVDEVAVPMTCPDSPRDLGRVLVYAGDAGTPRLLGDALPAQERAAVYRVEVRDGSLLVTGLTSSDPGAAEADTAVTARWVLTSGSLMRTERYTDPVEVLDVDAS